MYVYLWVETKEMREIRGFLDGLENLIGDEGDVYERYINLPSNLIFMCSK